MRPELFQFIFHRLPVVIYCIAIFIQSSFPAPEPISKTLFSDKFLHLAGYAVLGALFMRAFLTSSLKSRWRIILISMLCSSLYGISDEIHQSFVPSRSADVYDAVADTIGSILGVIIYYGSYRLAIKTVKKKSPEIP